MTKDAKKKPKYEAPVVALLGEIAAAAGVCQGGSLPDASGNCTIGISAALTCAEGGSAGSDCRGGSLPEGSG